MDNLGILEQLTNSDQQQSLKSLTAVQILQSVQNKVKGAEDFTNFNKIEKQGNKAENHADKTIIETCHKMRKESQYIRNANFRLFNQEKTKKAKNKQLKKELKIAQENLQQKLSRKEKLLEEKAYFSKKLAELMEHVPKIEHKKTKTGTFNQGRSPQQIKEAEAKSTILEIVASKAIMTTHQADQRTVCLGSREEVERGIKRKANLNEDALIDLFSIRKNGISAFSVLKAPEKPNNNAN